MEDDAVEVVAWRGGIAGGDLVAGGGAGLGDSRGAAVDFIPLAFEELEEHSARGTIWYSNRILGLVSGLLADGVAM